MKTKIGFITWVVCIVIACNTQPKGVKVKLVNDMPNYEIVKVRMSTVYYIGNSDSFHEQELSFNCNLKKQQDTVITFNYFNKHIIGMDVYFVNISNTDTILGIQRTDNSFNATANSGEITCLLSFNENQIKMYGKKRAAGIIYKFVDDATKLR